MRLTVIILTVMVGVALVGSAFAVGPGKTIEYGVGEPEGKVIFDGKTHADKGLKCTDCHTKIFPMKKSAELKMADMNAGKSCGTCHNGQKAFSTSDQANCAKCHKK